MSLCLDRTDVQIKRRQMKHTKTVILIHENIKIVIVPVVIILLIPSIVHRLASFLSGLVCSNP